MLNEAEILGIHEMSDVRFQAAGQIVNAYNSSSIIYEDVAHPGAQKTSASCYQNPLILKRNIPEILLYYIYLFFSVPSRGNPPG